MLKKTFPQILGGTAQGAAWVDQGPEWVKLVGDFGLSHTKPGPKYIGRFVERDFDPNTMLGKNPGVAASDYIHTYLERHILANPNINYWEGPNECKPNDLKVMGWYAEFLYVFAQILRQTYFKTAVLGNWSVGEPDYPLWAAYGKALKAIPAFGALHGRHNYAGPDQKTWPFLLLRHREDAKHFAKLGYPNVPTLITEWGADSVPFGNPNGQPWKRLYGGSGKEQANRYVDEILVPGDAELAKDPNVLGAFLFKLGGGDWQDFDAEGPVMDRLLPLVGPEPAPVPVPTPAPAPSPTPANPAAETFPHERVVATAGLNVREFPWRWSVEPPIVRTVKLNEVVSAHGALGGWYFINPAMTEWVRGDLTRRK